MAPHGTGIFTYIDLVDFGMVHVGQYTLHGYVIANFLIQIMNMLGKVSPMYRMDKRTLGVHLGKVVLPLHMENNNNNKKNKKSKKNKNNNNNKNRNNKQQQEQ